MSADIDLDDMSLETFKLWSTNALKAYLHIRNKITDGTFDELTARAYAAWCDNIEIDPELEQKERDVLDEYRSKLKFENTIFDDPLTLKDGWLGEHKDNGVYAWPSMNYIDIANYIGLKQPDFLRRMQSDYKQGKSFTYFACEFIREISINIISQESNYCMLKCRCIPSQRVNSKPYFVWAIVQKNTENKPGGQVLSAYCSCTAGLSGMCNHITAMFFRIEYAVRSGVTNPSKTSTLCSWNVPSGLKVNTKAEPISEMYFDKPHYMQDKDAKQKIIETKAKFKLFSPSDLSHQRKLKKKSNIREELFGLIKDDIKGSTLWECMEGLSVAGEAEKERLKNSVTLLSLPAEADEFTTNKNLNVNQNVNLFKHKLKYSTEQLAHITEITLSQNLSTDWHSHRKGRITASNFHRVFTKAKTLETNLSNKNIKNISTEALVSTLMGYKENPVTHALKHGVSLEAHAKRKYNFINKKMHKNLKTRDSGLVVLKENPYIGASPDLLLDCECCGSGLVEIKCPYSIKDQIPTHINLPYLEEVSDEKGTKVILKNNTSYYFQIQGQMAVTGRYYCDFFVYTHHGYFQERIVFLENFWTLLLEKLDFFWTNHVAPELLYKNILSKNLPVEKLPLNKAKENKEQTPNNGLKNISISTLTSQLIIGETPVKKKISVKKNTATISKKPKLMDKIVNEELTPNLNAKVLTSLVEKKTSATISKKPKFVDKIVKKELKQNLNTNDLTSDVDFDILTIQVDNRANIISNNANNTSNITTCKTPNELVNKSEQLPDKNAVIDNTTTSIKTPNKLANKTNETFERKQLPDENLNTNISNKTTKTNVVKKYIPKATYQQPREKRKCVESQKQILCKVAKLNNIFYCGICKKEISDSPAAFEQYSIGCDKCPIWYHFFCVGITKTSVPQSKQKWYCPECK